MLKDLFGGGHLVPLPGELVPETRLLLGPVLLHPLSHRPLELLPDDM